MRTRRYDRRGALALEPSAWGLTFATSEPEQEAPFEEIGGVAVVRISGPLTSEPGWWFDSYPQIVERVNAALESPCKALVLRIDSPGGDVDGCYATAREIRARAADAGVKVYAYADGCAASAAYALACAAERIYVADSARVGSIGVMLVTVDTTAMDRAMGLNFAVITSGARKADGHPHVPLSDQALGAMQGQVDTLAELFFEHVAAARSMKVEAVRGQQAAVFIGAHAVEAGLADGVATFDELLAIANGSQSTTAGNAAGIKKEATTMTFEEMLAELREKAKGEGDEAEKAKKMLKAIDAESDDKHGGEEKAEGGEESDDKKDDEKAEGDDKDGGEDDKKDGAGEQAAAAGVDVNLALTVNKMSAELASLRREREDRERRELIASRKDLAPELVAVLNKKTKAGAYVTPLATVREICKSVPKAARKDPAAAAKVATTQAAGQTGNVVAGVSRTSTTEEQQRLDAAFGMAAATAPIRREGGTVTFSAMTPEEARKHLETTKTTKEVGT